MMRVQALACCYGVTQRGLGWATELADEEHLGGLEIYAES